MILSVNPNRMELLRLKRRLALARRGYKLLKDKRDALIQQFIKLVHENRKIREEFEKKMRDCMNRFVVASLYMGDKDLDSIFLFPMRETRVKTNFQNIMSVQVPRYEIIGAIMPTIAAAYPIDLVLSIVKINILLFYIG